MQRSTDRFLTTHTGSLPRPDDLVRMMYAKEEGVPVDAPALPSRIRAAVEEIVAVGEHSFYMLHDIGELDLDPPTAGFAAVIFGHSHQPSIETRDGVLFLNPGSAGPRRFKLPVSVARIRVSGGALDSQIVTLNV